MSTEERSSYLEMRMILLDLQAQVAERSQLLESLPNN